MKANFSANLKVVARLQGCLRCWAQELARFNQKSPLRFYWVITFGLQGQTPSRKFQGHISQLVIAKTGYAPDLTLDKITTGQKLKHLTMRTGKFFARTYFYSHYTVNQINFPLNLWEGFVFTSSSLYYNYANNFSQEIKSKLSFSHVFQRKRWFLW